MSERCLTGSRCAVCATVVFPRMPVCPKCQCQGTMSDAGLGDRGTLYSHTIAYVAPAGFTAPFYQAFVDMPAGPRLFTLIAGDVPVEHGRLADGMEMRLVFEPVAQTPENRERIGYKFTPVPPAAPNRNPA